MIVRSFFCSPVWPALVLFCSAANFLPFIYCFIGKPITNHPHVCSVCLSVYKFILPSVCLSIHLCVHTSVSPSIHLSIHLPVHPSIRPSIHLSDLSAHPFIHLSVRPFIHLTIYLSVHPSVRPSICLPVCLSFCLSVWRRRPLSALTTAVTWEKTMAIETMTTTIMTSTNAMTKLTMMRGQW